MIILDKNIKNMQIVKEYQIIMDIYYNDNILTLKGNINSPYEEIGVHCVTEMEWTIEKYNKIENHFKNLFKYLCSKSKIDVYSTISFDEDNIHNMVLEEENLNYENLIPFLEVTLRVKKFYNFYFKDINLLILGNFDLRLVLIYSTIDSNILQEISKNNLCLL